MRTFRLIALSTLVFCALLHVGHAQTAEKTHRLGVLTATTAPSPTEPRLIPVLRVLASRGYSLERNLALESRGAGTQVARLPQLAGELAAAKVDVILTYGYPAAFAAKQATSRIPIVMTGAGDPVESGLVAALARPGGNLTGMAEVAAELSAKRLELLKEAVPGLKRVAMLWNAEDLGMTLRYRASAAAAQKLGIVVQSLGVREPNDFDAAFDAMTRERPDAILMVTDLLTNLNRKRIYEFAAAQKLPAIYEYHPFVRDGGLMSYGPNPVEMYEQVGDLVARVFAGAKPAELPLRQPARFLLAINLKTAKALGLSVPPALLARADEVFE